MIIYIFDERWPDNTFAIPFLHQAVGSWVKKKVIKQTESVFSVAMQILGMTNGKPGSIDQLRLCAHGNSGFLQLGVDGLASGNASHFAVLKGFFRSHKEDGRGIEIHGCGVASSTGIWQRRFHGTPGHGGGCVSGTARFSGNGHTFLTRLARATGTKVTAAFDCQFVDPGFRFEGQGVTTVYPALEEAKHMGFP